MNFLKWPPPQSLKNIIQYFWAIDGGSAGNYNGTESFVPGGCVQMGFDFGGKAYYYQESQSLKLRPSAYVEGTYQRVFSVKYAQINCSFGILFYPGQFHAISDYRFGQSSERIIPVEEVFGKKGLELYDKLASASTNPERVIIASDFITSILSEIRWSSEIGYLIKFSGHLALSGSDLKAEDLLEASYSDRHLRRIFNDRLGLSPKKFKNIIRLERAVASVMKEPHQSLTSICLNNGYFDQSHFNHEFKSIIGVTPRRYFSNTNQLDKHYFARF